MADTSRGFIIETDRLPIPSASQLRRDLLALVRGPRRRVQMPYQLPQSFARQLTHLGECGWLDPTHDLAEEFAVSGWDLNRALRALKIERVPFRKWLTEDGRGIEGYSYRRTFAVSPLAAAPHAICLHECAHVELGHTARKAMNSDAEHRIATREEIEADAVSLTCLRSLRLSDSVSAARLQWISRSYKGADLFSPAMVAQIRSTAQRIVDAGWTGEIRL